LPFRANIAAPDARDRNGPGIQPVRARGSWARGLREGRRAGGAALHTDARAARVVNLMDSLDGHRRAVRLAAVGGAEVAQVLAEQLDQVGNDIAAIERVLRLARAELDRTVRRPLAAVYAETADDLAALVVERGEGFAASEVSVALRETPTFVRRARLAAGVDPGCGRDRSERATVGLRAQQRKTGDQS
jgi:hypothetical protein